MIIELLNENLYVVGKGKKKRKEKKNRLRLTLIYMYSIYHKYSYIFKCQTRDTFFKSNRMVDAMHLNVM